MPATEIRVYRETDGDVPLQTWLAEVRRSRKVVYAKCLQRILLLSQLGYELQRPLAGTLGNDLYELRIRNGSVNYRILYFFIGQNAVVLSHGLTKESDVPDADINLALRRKKAVEKDRTAHTAEWNFQ